MATLGHTNHDLLADPTTLPNKGHRARGNVHEADGVQTGARVGEPGTVGTDKHGAGATHASHHTLLQ